MAQGVVVMLLSFETYLRGKAKIVLLFLFTYAALC